MRGLLTWALMAVLLGAGPLPALAGQTFVMDDVPVGEHRVSMVKRVSDRGVIYRVMTDGVKAFAGRGKTAEAAVNALFLVLKGARQEGGFERLGRLIHVTGRVTRMLTNEPRQSLGLFLAIPGERERETGFYPDTLFMPEAFKLKEGDTVELVAIPRTDGEDIVISVEKVD